MMILFLILEYNLDAVVKDPLSQTHFVSWSSV